MKVKLMEDIPMSDNRNYQELKIESLVPFFNHPFSQYEGQRFADMVESVRANGILMPIVVRPSADGKYEILSGHNRVAAAKEAGLESVPAVVQEGLTNDEAMFIVTETNLIQRSFADMKHSERAVVIAVHYDAMKKKSGYRSDLIEDIGDATSVQVAPRSWTSDKLGEQYGLSSDTIKRYLRVNKLIQPLKEQLDKGVLGIVAAVSFSYLRESEQEIVSELFAENKKIGIRQAVALRKESAERELSKDDILKVLNPDKPTATTIKVPRDILSQYFDEDVDEEKIQFTIAEALEAYFRNRSE